MMNVIKTMTCYYNSIITKFINDLLQNLRSFKLALSLGGVESLVEQPASMSHGPFCMSDEDRQETHIDPALIRLRYYNPRIISK